MLSACFAMGLPRHSARARPAAAPRDPAGSARWRLVGLPLAVSLLPLPCLAQAAVPAAAPPAEPVANGLIRHQGPCNASTALAFGDGLFVMAENKAGPTVPLQLHRSGVAGAA